MPIRPIWVHWVVLSRLVRYLAGCWVVDGIMSAHELPIGPLSASHKPTVHYIYNSYNPNARFAINH